VLVAFHDASVDRVSDGSGLIEEISFRDLESLKIAGREHIASVDELLETFPEGRFNIDLKSESAIEPLAGAIRRHKAASRVCVTSFSLSRLNRFRALMGPGVATSGSLPEVGWNRFVPGLPRLVNSPATALEFPVSYLIGRLRMPVLGPIVMGNARARGKKVIIWTVNDPAEMNRLIDYGVDGLISDDLSSLKAVLVDRGIWQ
jgi:glycerophosphoryl diester phosphodiesterase